MSARKSKRQSRENGKAERGHGAVDDETEPMGVERREKAQRRQDYHRCLSLKGESPSDYMYKGLSIAIVVCTWPGMC
jgi:hypothetical protein